MTELPPRSNECVYCEIRWPLEPKYDVCPQCRESTLANTRTATLSKNEAEELAAQRSFGWYLWDNGLL